MSSVHFFIGLFVPWVWSLISSSLILDTSHLSDMSFTNIFSHSVVCLLVLSAVSFAVMMIVHFCLCFPCLWRCVSKEVVAVEVKEVAACVLLQDFSGFLSHFVGPGIK